MAQNEIVEVSAFKRSQDKPARAGSLTVDSEGADCRWQS